MGINRLFKEVKVRDPVPLRELAIETFTKTGRPLRLAIDISIWQFQARTARGGENPAMRVLFYRLVRLLGIPIQAVFVFDGPEKPRLKRNKRSGLGSVFETAQVKTLIRLFGSRAHNTPGEAEAKCALLQQLGIVDAVLSEDVDTLMFGCTKILRDAAANRDSSKALTSVSVYNSLELCGGAHLDRDDIALVALLSSSDYSPGGIPGLGIKIACKAAVAGFSKSLSYIKPSDKQALDVWKRRLLHKLRSNQTGYFRTKHKALDIPNDFPDFKALQNYRHPVVSPPEGLEKVKKSLQETREVDVVGLREFVKRTFGWTCKTGATKFVRVLAPSLLVHLLLTKNKLDYIQTAQEVVSRRVKHGSATEFRVHYIPANIVRIDLKVELEEAALEGNGDIKEKLDGQPKEIGTRKSFDPLEPDHTWIPEYFAQLGSPLVVRELKADRLKKSATKGMPFRALHKWLIPIETPTVTKTPRCGQKRGQGA